VPTSNEHSFCEHGLLLPVGLLSVMSSLFRRTRLYALIQEVRAEYSLVRRREHRFALKTQRALVRMKIMSEMQRSAIDRVRFLSLPF
jgi:hypothetical protein